MPVTSIANPSPDQLAARQQLADNAGSAKQRKRDTRRKIVAGAALLTEAMHNPVVHQIVRTVLTARVTRPLDRAVVADLLEGGTEAGLQADDLAKGGDNRLLDVAEFLRDPHAA